MRIRGFGTFGCGKINISLKNHLQIPPHFTRILIAVFIRFLQNSKKVL